MNWQHLIAILPLILLHSGCNMVSPGTSNSPLENNLFPGKLSQGEAVTGPTRMAIIWKENVLQPPAKKPVRGFTGRIYFYNSQDELVTADGELAVFGYDDSQTSLKEIADRKYVFPAEKFATHYAKSELGHSYSIWIPWEEYGGFRKSISLVPVFKLANDQIIQGSADHLSLSGRVPHDATIEKTIAYGPDSFPADNNSRTSSQEGRRHQPQGRQVQTLQIPESLAKRMANLPPTWEQAAKRPTQYLDNVAKNQSGDAYNVVHQSQKNYPPAQPPQPVHRPTHAIQQPPLQTQSNFSDTPAGSVTLQQSSLPVQQPPQRRVFGQPGTIR